MKILDRLFIQPLRRVLLSILIATEKTSSAEQPPSVSTRKESVLLKDIHIPPTLVSLISSLFLVSTLLLSLGWSWRNFLGVSIFILMAILLFVFYMMHEMPEMAGDDESVMLLGTITILFTAMIVSLKGWPVAVYLTPIPAASILATLLLNVRISLILTLLLSVLMGLVYGFVFDIFFLSLVAGIAGTASASYIRSHKDFIRAGAVIALVGVAALGILAVMESWDTRPYLWAALWTALNGFASAILALGILPFLESFFLKLSPIKLLELADFNRSLLKQLMMEAPGTYHHSLLVATIAESAAEAIGANPLLCRVGAYYHDIGKLIKPEYFIENQGALASNPHGKIAPQLSSLVVISHIKEGISLARKAKIPQDIINFIPMHHGTSRIEYFYNQAKENAQDEMMENGGEQEAAEVQEEHYRYPGPRPQSKETALVMLADSVEAASRTLEDPTHPRLKDLVQSIVGKKLSDGQLSSTPLTFADLSKIEESFVNTLTSVYHARIEYPDPEEKPAV